MDHLIVSIHPFIRQQNISIYKNGECIKICQCTLDDMEKTVVALCKEYSIDNVDTIGGQLFALKLKEKTEVATDFDYSHININIH